MRAKRPVTKPPRSEDDSHRWGELFDWPAATSKVLLLERHTALISLKAKVVEHNIRRIKGVFRGDVVVEPVDANDFTDVANLFTEQGIHLSERVVYKPLDSNGRLLMSFRAPYSEKESGTTSVSVETFSEDPLGYLTPFDAKKLVADDIVSVVARLEALPSVHVQDDYDLALGILSICHIYD